MKNLLSSYILIPEKDDFLGNSQSNTPNLQFQQNKMKFNLDFNAQRKTQ
jgi:hypothetical protein